MAIATIVVSLIACGGVLSSQSAYDDALDGPSASSVSQAGSSDPSKTDSDETSDANKLSIGDTLTLEDGLKVTVNETKKVSQYGSSYVGIRVTYKNTGDATASYNFYDWKGEDKDGALEEPEYTSFDNELSSGDLKPGGKKTAWVYLPKASKKACYFSSTFADEPVGSWVLK